MKEEAVKDMPTPRKSSKRTFVLIFIWKARFLFSTFVPDVIVVTPSIVFENLWNVKAYLRFRPLLQCTGYQRWFCDHWRIIFDEFSISTT